MILLGVVVVIIGAVLFSTFVVEGNMVGIGCGVFILAFGIYSVVYDVGSPVETIVEPRVIFTNDYSQYGLNRQSTKFGKIQKITKKPTNKGAIVGISIEYVFIDFVEESK